MLDFESHSKSKLVQVVLRIILNQFSSTSIHGKTNTYFKKVFRKILYSIFKTTTEN